MTRYGIYLADLRRDQNDSQGTINYALGLAAELPTLLEPDEQLFFLANPAIESELSFRGGDAPVVDLVKAPNGTAARLALDHVRSVLWARRRRLDVIHFPKGHLPLRVPNSLATIATVHDDIPVRYARNDFGAGGRNAKTLYFARTVRHAVAGADRVLTVSQFSAARLARLSRDGTTKTVVTYEAPSLPEQPYVPLAERNQRILIFGSSFPHKRTAQAVHWAYRFVESAGQGRFDIVVTGGLDAATEHACATLGVKRLREVLSLQRLAELVSRSRGLVFSSVYEGFGLPPVEAFSLGTPATYQRVGAMAEVLDGFPGAYEDATYDAFAAALTSVLTLDDAQLSRLQTTMRRRYRWSDVANRTLGAYRSAAHRTQQRGSKQEM